MGNDAPKRICACFNTFSASSQQSINATLYCSLLCGMLSAVVATPQGASSAAVAQGRECGPDENKVVRACCWMTNCSTGARCWLRKVSGEVQSPRPSASCTLVLHAAWLFLGGESCYNQWRHRRHLLPLMAKKHNAARGAYSASRYPAAHFAGPAGAS